VISREKKEDEPASTLSMYEAPLHFWCVRTSHPISFSFLWINSTYASIPSVLYLCANSANHPLIVSNSMRRGNRGGRTGDDGGGVQSGERDELEDVACLAEVPDERLEFIVRESVSSPVERRGEVVHEPPDTLSLE
jgi:hypothetical protein